MNKKIILINEEENNARLEEIKYFNSLIDKIQKEKLKALTEIEREYKKKKASVKFK